MGSKSTASLALFLSLNLLFFALASACGTCPCSTCQPSPPEATCPKDTQKLGVCANLLGLIGVVVGNPPETPCCSLTGGLADLVATVCLCTAIKGNSVCINLNIPLSLTLLLNVRGKKVPFGFNLKP